MLKHSLGARSPIFRLETDSLRAIFEFVADVDRPHPDSPSVVKCWMKIGHICRLWRLILLDMPALWARDLCVFGWHTSFDMILGRARDAPLCLDFFPNLRHGGLEDAPSDLIARMAPLVARARELSYFVEASKDYDTIVAAISQHTSSLKELTVDWYMPKTADATWHPVRLPPDSCINYLEMQNIIIFPPLNGCLTRLIINLISLPDEIRFPHHEIVDILLGNPALELVEMRNAMREGHTQLGRPRIVLPKLAHFGVQRNAARACPSTFSLLALLDLPAVTNLRIIESHVSTRAQVSEGFDAVLRACSTSPILASPTISLHVDREWTFRTQLPPMLKVSISSTPCAISPSGNSIHPVLILSTAPDSHAELERTESNAMLMAVLHQLEDVGLPDRVVRLSWAPDPSEAEPEYWSTVLCPFPNVSYLTVRGNTNAIINSLDTLRRCDDDVLVVPHLSCLEISHDKVLEEFPWSAHFEVMLHERAGAGRPIREVRLGKPLLKPAPHETSLPRYVAVIDYMEAIARRLDASMVVQEWSESWARGALGTAFILDYKDSSV
ncbi:unnamed protein product [Peniophora sp. CBMAI 1063]|nr:unnamed protein product [Peniophora sp. CBMAI 1063]